LSYGLGLDVGSLWRGAHIGFALQGPDQVFSGAFGLQQNILTGDTGRSWSLGLERAPYGFSFASEVALLTETTTYGVSRLIGGDSLFLFTQAKRTIALPSITQQASDSWTYSVGLGGIPVAGANLSVAAQHTGGFVITMQSQDGWQVSGEFPSGGGAPIVHLSLGGQFVMWNRP
jgi:hypothetical protein